MTEPDKYPPCENGCEREGRYEHEGKYICDECKQHEIHKPKDRDIGEGNGYNVE